jgi:hypothetical protein
MVLPLALLSAAPAAVGFLGNLFDSDRSEARRLAREAALGNGPGTQAAKAAVQDAQRGMLSQARSGSMNPLLSERNAMLAGADLQSRVAPAIMQQQAAEQVQGRRDLATLGQQQGGLLQQGLGALSSGLAGATGFLAANPAQQQQGAAPPSAAPPAPAFGTSPPTATFGAGPPAAAPGAPPALGGFASQLQLPPGMQSLDPRLLMQLGFGGGR